MGPGWGQRPRHSQLGLASLYSSNGYFRESRREAELGHQQSQNPPLKVYFNLRLCQVNKATQYATSQSFVLPGGLTGCNQYPL